MSPIATRHTYFRSRSLRLGMLTAAIAAASMTTIAAVRLTPHDSRLDDADAALEKAQVLLAAVNCSSSDKAMKECERRVDRAIEAIADARDDVAAAGAAQDAGGLSTR